MWFNLINYFYNEKDMEGKRLWEMSRVKEAVALKKITTEEYKQITNEDYIA